MLPTPRSAALLLLLRPVRTLCALPDSRSRIARTISSAAEPDTPSTSNSIFLVTSPNNELSRKIASTLLEKKLCACVTVVPKITSMYWWEGKVQEDAEELLIIKSTTAMAAQLEAEVKALHSYDTPEFISIPITGGSEEYLKWIKDSVSR